MSVKEKITMIIVDNDINFAIELKENFANNRDIEVIEISTSGEEALERILELQPDIALIDLIMPGNDGLWVLEELAARRYRQTGIIAMSCFENQMISQIAVDLGAEYFIIKSLNYESLKRRIIQIHNNRISRIIKSPEELVITTESIGGNAVEDRDTSLKYLISDMITKLGISPSLNGYHYIRSSSMIMIDENDFTISITKRIYPEVAKEHNTTAGKVERAIRHAIDSSWKNCKGKLYSEVFEYNFLKKPTNGQIIANIAEYVRLRHL